MAKYYGGTRERRYPSPQSPISVDTQSEPDRPELNYVARGRKRNLFNGAAHTFRIAGITSKWRIEGLRLGV